MIENRAERLRGELNARLAEIASVIDRLPEAERAKLQGLVHETRGRHSETEQKITRAYARLDDWRMRAKYRVFDAEARQREAQENRGDSGGTLQVA